MKPVEIQVTYDFICPWCWIGHQNLKVATQRMNGEVAPRISYSPYELNPDMPKAGVDRKAYRTAKFGSWSRSQSMDAEVALVGRRLGLTFNYDAVAITPNTRLAHRLMVLAQRTGSATMVEGLFEAIFAAYFSRGENIGLIDVLAPLAASVGFDEKAVRDYLASEEGEAEVIAEEMRASLSGIRSVPTIRIGEAIIGGAQPPAVMEQALQAASAKAASALETL